MAGKQNHTIPFARLFTMTQREFVARANLTYGQSGSIMLYLYDQQLLRKYYDAVKANYDKDKTGKLALELVTGKTLAEVAKLRGTSPEDTAIDLVIADGTRVGTAYFLMDEANVARQTALPWMSFGSDAEASAPRGKFLLSSTHPRAYGNVARLLGKYVRDEHRLSLAEAVRKLTSLPAANLGIKDRGLVRPGMMADLAIFDPATIADKATFEQPQQFAVGMRHVLVNGHPVLLDGEMTEARPGRAVHGPGTGRCPPR